MPAVEFIASLLLHDYIIMYVLTVCIWLWSDWHRFMQGKGLWWILG